MDCWKKQKGAEHFYVVLMWSAAVNGMAAANFVLITTLLGVKSLNLVWLHYFEPNYWFIDREALFVPKKYPIEFYKLIQFSRKAHGFFVKFFDKTSDVFWLAPE